MAALVPILVATVRAVRGGWLPVADNAFFRIRANDVLTNNDPLLGTWASVSVALAPARDPGLHFDGPVGETRGVTVVRDPEPAQHGSVTAHPQSATPPRWTPRGALSIHLRMSGWRDLRFFASPVRRWWFGLGTIMLIGFGIRLLYVHVHTQDIAVLSDPFYYHGGANLLVEGHGFVDPYHFVLEGRSLPGAYHPPGYLLSLALASLAGFKNLFAHQVWSAMLGTATIAVTGLAGRRIAGARAGLVAASVSAVYPNFWFSDALVMSETLVLLAMAATLLAAYRFWDRPDFGRAVVLGVFLGVTALSRSEAVLLLLLLAVPLVAFLPKDGFAWRRRLALLAMIWGAATVIVGPWVAYNLSRFEEPVYLSVSYHTLLAGNCEDRYEGDLVGYWSVGCVVRLNCPNFDKAERDLTSPCLLKVDPEGDGSTHELRYREQAITNLRENLDRLPFLVFAREGRTWGFYRPGQQLQLDTLSTREIELSRLGLGIYYTLVAGTIAGTLILRRRRVPVFPLLVPIVSVALTVSLTFGETRYRALAEVSLVLGAAVAFDAVLPSRRRPSPPQSPERSSRPNTAAVTKSRTMTKPTGSELSIGSVVNDDGDTTR